MNQTIYLFLVLNMLLISLVVTATSPQELTKNDLCLFELLEKQEYSPVILNSFLDIELIQPLGDSLVMTISEKLGFASQRSKKIHVTIWNHKTQKTFLEFEARKDIFTKDAPLKIKDEHSEQINAFEYSKDLLNYVQGVMDGSANVSITINNLRIHSEPNEQSYHSENLILVNSEGETLQKFHAHFGHIQHVLLLDHTHFASIGAQENCIKIWELNGTVCELKSKIEVTREKSQPSCLAYLDKERLIVSTSQKDIQVWNWKNETLEAKFFTKAGWVPYFANLQNGQMALQQESMKHYHSGRIWIIDINIFKTLNNC